MPAADHERSDDRERARPGRRRPRGALGPAPREARGRRRRPRLRGDLPALPPERSIASAWRSSAIPRTPRTRCRTRWSRCCGRCPESGGRSSLKPWLYRIAHNESIELLRRRRETGRLDAELPAPGAGPRRGGRRRGNVCATCSPTSASCPSASARRSAHARAGGPRLRGDRRGAGTSPAVARQTLYEARLSLRQMDEGREMSCADGDRALSDGDGRVDPPPRHPRPPARPAPIAGGSARKSRRREARPRRRSRRCPPPPRPALLHGLLGHGAGWRGRRPRGRDRRGRRQIGRRRDAAEGGRRGRRDRRRRGHGRRPGRGDRRRPARRRRRSPGFGATRRGTRRRVETALRDLRAASCGGRL